MGRTRWWVGRWAGPGAGAVLAVAVGAGAVSGDLTPPAGPVAPTMKPLDVVEPRLPLTQETAPGDADSVFRITRPGSYYLVGDVVGEPGKHGVFILTDGAVTLDLSGFSLRGAPGARSGVLGALYSAAAVRNGMVLDWPLDGLDMDTAGSGGVRLESLQVVNNGGRGASLGFFSIVRGCAFSLNGEVGLAVQHGSIVESCSAVGNGEGFSLASASTIRDCLASSNAGPGFVLRGRSVAENNFATNHSLGPGFRTMGVGNTLRGNVATGNQNGFVVQGEGNTVLSCVSTGSAGEEFVIAPNNAVAPRLTTADLAVTPIPFANITD